MSQHYTLHVPVEGKDNIKRYPRVGVLFHNHNSETGEEYFTIKLDFPVGATELLAFPPKPRDVQAADEPAGEERAA